MASREFCIANSDGVCGFVEPQDAVCRGAERTRSKLQFCAAGPADSACASREVDSIDRAKRGLVDRAPIGCSLLSAVIGEQVSFRSNNVRIGTVLLIGLTQAEKAKQVRPSSQLGTDAAEIFVTGLSGCFTDSLLSGHGIRDALRGSFAEITGTIIPP